MVAVVVMLIMYFGTGSTKARTKYPWLVINSEFKEYFRSIITVFFMV